jgi:alkylated DNA repair dioxygenase AlkB
MRKRPLFDVESAPDGFRYEPEFLSSQEEASLLERISRLEFGEVRMRGVAARRRVVQFGWHYSFESFKLTAAPPPPTYLSVLQERAAAFAGVSARALSEVLVTEYQPGATIGWHRDAPPFDIVVGISLASACRFRFKRATARGVERYSLNVAPRSIYLLDGPARRDWQHSIPAVRAMRYSITFRTIKGKKRSRAPRPGAAPAVPFPV